MAAMEGVFFRETDKMDYFPSTEKASSALPGIPMIMP
jgi:hypothetical protein